MITLLIIFVTFALFVYLDCPMRVIRPKWRTMKDDVFRINENDRDFP